MAASKDKEVKPSGLQQFSRWIQYVPGGALLFAAAPLLILGYFAWYYWGAHHLDTALYAVKLENLVTTPQPTWIRSTKVRDEVFKAGGLGQLSLLDPQASATIAHAFESHSWVQRATYVKKNANGKVNVDLIYRRPIAMIYYERSDFDPKSNQVKKGYFPVDEEAVVLPMVDFDSSQVTSYFLVYLAGATPPSDVGMAFSDARIRQSLVLCRFLESVRAELRLEAIYIERDVHLGDANPWELFIQTSDKRRIKWGHAPGAESLHEPLAQEKLAALTSWRADTRATIEIDLTKPQLPETKLTSGVR